MQTSDSESDPQETPKTTNQCDYQCHIQPKSGRSTSSLRVDWMRPRFGRDHASRHIQPTGSSDANSGEDTDAAPSHLAARPTMILEHGGVINAMCADDVHVCTSSDDGVIRVFDVTDLGRCVYVHDQLRLLQDRPTSVSFVNSSFLVLVGTAKGALYLLDASGGMRAPGRIDVCVFGLGAAL